LKMEATTLHYHKIMRLHQSYIAELENYLVLARVKHTLDSILSPQDDKENKQHQEIIGDSTGYDSKIPSTNFYIFPSSDYSDTI